MRTSGRGRPWVRVGVAMAARRRCWPGARSSSGARATPSATIRRGRDPSQHVGGRSTARSRWPRRRPLRRRVRRQTTGHVRRPEPTAARSRRERQYNPNGYDLRHRRTRTPTSARSITVSIYDPSFDVAMRAGDVVLRRPLRYGFSTSYQLFDADRRRQQRSRPTRHSGIDTDGRCTTGHPARGVRGRAPRRSERLVRPLHLHARQAGDLPAPGQARAAIPGVADSGDGTTASRSGRRPAAVQPAVYELNRMSVFVGTVRPARSST